MTTPLLLERSGRVATLTLNRPAALNTLDFTLMDALVEAAAELAADDTLRVVVLRGAGRHFMAGGDLRTFAGELAKPAAQRDADFRRMISRLHSAIENFHRMPHPIVARVTGAVAGFGLSLMNACDLVVASDDTYFASAYRNIGLTPDGGGSWSLPRLVGTRRAMEIFLLGERFSAQQALEWGLLNRVVPAAELDAAVARIVQSLADGPVLALRNAKRLVREATTSSLAQQLDAEARSIP
jgi:2-(1,2-epoxy-1,2-dihydrophenyl)acetyl-CoA isomerase